MVFLAAVCLWWKMWERCIISLCGPSARKQRSSIYMRGQKYVLEPQVLFLDKLCSVDDYEGDLTAYICPLPPVVRMLNAISYFLSCELKDIIAFLNSQSSEVQRFGWSFRTLDASSKLRVFEGSSTPGFSRIIKRSFTLHSSSTPSYTMAVLAII